MIGASVGRGGQNKSGDVEVVQKLINARSYLRVAGNSLAAANDRQVYGPVLEVSAPYAAMGAGRVAVGCQPAALSPVHCNAQIFPPLAEDGVYGPNTQQAIDQVERGLDQFYNSSVYRGAPFQYGIIFPQEEFILKLWPVAYANPTGKKIRGTDAYGSGHHGASRGSRVHDGADYVATAGQSVLAPMSGVVKRKSNPYSSGIDVAKLSGVLIEGSDGGTCQVWYITPDTGIVGSIVEAGKSQIGVAATLTNRYKNGMTDHVHVRIHDAANAQINPATVIK